MTEIQMLDSKHVKVIWAGRPRKLTHVISSDNVRDVRRRSYTPSFTITQPLIRRPSLDGSALLKSKNLTVKRDTSSIAQTQPSIQRAHSFRDVIIRDSVPRKQTTAPAATKLTHEVEIKPILKSGNKCSYVLPTADDKPSEQSSQNPSPSPDGKFCYKLPGKPAPKLRKTVSFKEDMVSSRTVLSYKRNFTSPSLSIPNGVLGRDGQVYV